MRTRDNGQSSSEDDDDNNEDTPLIQNPVPPRPPRPPPPPAPPLPPPPPAGRAQSSSSAAASQPMRGLPPTSNNNNTRTSQQQNPISRQRQQQSQQQQAAAPAPVPVVHLPPLPPPDQPPPPPPPPPPAICSAEWVLRLRHPGRGILNIHVPRGMTAYLLSQCIIQATDFREETVVGLFGYNNGMFVSLEHLLSCSETSLEEETRRLHKQVYSLYMPQPVPQPPWWHDWRIISGTTFLILAVLYQQLPTILYLIASIPILLENIWNQLFHYVPLFYHSLVTKPLQDTYRYGPAFFGGWEGADLPTICARITYGDRDFWARNYRDCENMFLKKQSAFLFVGRPLMFFILVVIMVWIMRQFIWYHALYQRQHHYDQYQDRDMIQTYRAMQVLFRQMNRMMRANNNNHYSQNTNERGGGGGRRHRDEYDDD